MRFVFHPYFYNSNAFFVLVFGLFVVKANAQQPVDTTHNKQLNDAIVTGQYGETSLQQSVYKVKVIDNKRIQQQGAVSLKDVLANELNIRINQDPSLGSSVNIQGVTGQGIKILIDGVPIIGREGGNIDLTQVNLNNVERIEIVEGPMSVSFGTDAMGGVINIIMKRPVQKQLQAHAATYTESIGQYNTDFGIGLAGKKLGAALSFGRNFFDGYDLKENESRYRTWKPREQYFSDLTITYEGKIGKLKLQQSYFNELVISRDSGTITPFYAYGLDEYYRTKRLTQNLFYDKKINANHHVQIVVSYSNYKRYKNTMRKDLVSLTEEMTTAPEQHDTNSFQLWMSRGLFSKNKPGSKFNYQVGYETNYEISTGKKITDSYQDISDYSLFTSFEYKPHHRFTLRPGLRTTYNSRFNAPLIPSINLKWDVASRIRIRASYGKGFRAPTLKEMYLSFVDPSHNIHGNPDLNAETSDNVQLFATYEIGKQKHVFKVEPGLFYNHVKNMIDLVMLDINTLHASYTNIASFTSTGINVITEYKTPVYSFQAGYARMGRSSSYHVDNVFFYSNEYRFNATVTHPKRSTSLAIFYKYNGRLQAYQYNYIHDNVQLAYVNAFALLDITASQPFFKKRLLVTAGSKNVLDVHNVQASLASGVHMNTTNNATVAMGRTYFISLRYTITRKQRA